VRGVGDEALLLVDPLLQPVQHPVERDRQPMELVRAPGEVDPLVEAGTPDLAGLLRHARDRPERPSGQEPAPHAGHSEDRWPGDEQQHDQAMHRAVHGVERCGDHDRSVAGVGTEPDGEDPERLGVRAPRHARPQLFSGEHPTDLFHSEERSIDDGIAGGLQHRGIRRDHLRARCSERESDERGVGHILELALASVLQAEGDLRRSCIQLAVDPTDEIGAEPDHQERAECDEDQREEAHVPGRQPGADRQAHEGSKA
jgi:hypothetical protein